jgi:heme-degrading monooxygenase HmoA
VYLDTPYVSVHWESAGPWVFVEWKAWANSTEYRAAHGAILGAIRDHRAARVLIDARDA